MVGAGTVAAMTAGAATASVIASEVVREAGVEPTMELAAALRAALATAATREWEMEERLAAARAEAVEVVEEAGATQARVARRETWQCPAAAVGSKERVAASMVLEGWARG